MPSAARCASSSGDVCSSSSWDLSFEIPQMKKIAFFHVGLSDISVEKHKKKQISIFKVLNLFKKVLLIYALRFQLKIFCISDIRPAVNIKHFAECK